MTSRERDTTENNEPETRARLALYASEITERFGLKKIMEMWETTICDAITQSKA